MTDTSKPQAMEPSGVTGRIFACLMERMNEKAYRWTADMLGSSAPRHLHEIGFGTGRFLELAATRLPVTHVTGVDPSELMVTRARQRLSRRHPSLRVDLRQGTDASDFWPGETIDACVALHSFQFWQNPDETLRRLRDRLHEKGLLILVLRRHGRNPPGWLPNPVSRSEEEIPETRKLLEKTGFSLVTDKALDSASWGSGDHTTLAWLQRGNALPISPRMTPAFKSPVYCALDTTDLAQAMAWATAIRPWVGGIKLGLEFFNAHGPQGIEKMRAIGLPVFADLKLHDIPNTVAGGIRAVLPLGVSIVNVHASGGQAMMRAAADAAATAGANRPKVIGVTVLTSLDANDLASAGVNSTPAEQVVRLATLAKTSGLDGVVCSAHEIEPLRKALGHNFMLIVPGIRPAGADVGDQKRVMTPREAMQRGANILVIGRPITGATDPAAAARAIHDDLAAG